MEVLNITTDQAQELRTQGNWIVSDRRYTKVYLVTKDKVEAQRVYRKEYDRTVRRNANIWSPLRKVVTTQADIDRANMMHRLGLNYPMTDLY